MNEHDQWVLDTADDADEEEPCDVCQDRVATIWCAMQDCRLHVCEDCEDKCCSFDPGGNNGDR